MDAYNTIAACLQASRIPADLYPRIADVAREWLKFSGLSKRDQDGVRQRISELREDCGVARDDLNGIFSLIEDAAPETRPALLEWIGAGATSTYPLAS